MSFLVSKLCPVGSAADEASGSQAGWRGEVARAPTPARLAVPLGPVYPRRP